jgi:sulfur-carrier protein
VITVRLFAAAREAAGCQETTTDASTLAELIRNLEQTFGPDLANVLPRCSFLIDGVAAHGPTAKLMLRPGATVDVLPPFAGG